MIKEVYDIFPDSKHGVYQIRTKSEAFTIEFTGEEERAIFDEAILKMQKHKVSSFDELSRVLNKKYNKDKVIYVLNELKEYNIIDESYLKDDFGEKLKEQMLFWGTGSAYTDTPSAKETQTIIENTKLALLGNGITLDLLASKAGVSGFKNIQKVEISPTLDEGQLEKVISASDFFIVDADRWSPYHLENINIQAIKFKKPWIIVRGINAMSGSVGPLFLPDETGCYNCLYNRIKSNMDFLPYFQEYEKHLRNSKDSSRSEGAPILIYDILSSIAILETIKYITDWTIPIVYNSFISISIYSYEFKIHPFLKAPVCPTCKPSVDFSPAPWLEPVSLK